MELNGMCGSLYFPNCILSVDMLDDISGEMQKEYKSPLYTCNLLCFIVIEMKRRKI